MNAVVTWMLFAVVAALLVEGFVRPERFYQYPFLAAAMTFAFILPQAPGVAADPFLPEGGYVKVCVVGILSLLLLRLGWNGRPQPLALFDQRFSETKLLLVAAVFSAIGAFFYVKLSRLPGDLTVGVQMTGVPVIYLFFARLMVYGLVIATMCFVRRPSMGAGAIIIVDAALYLDRILVTGKRAESVEIFLIAALALWFHRGWVMPRTFVFAGMLAATIGMSSMSDYRDITRRSGSFELEQITQIDVVANFEALMKAGGPELRNAVHFVDFTDRTQKFDFGAVHWNHLVFNYVPAQIVGARFKNSLMLPTPAPARSYEPLTGTTSTGITDAFQSFWYFGALKFLLLSYLLSRLWGSAMAGSTTAQIVYVLSIVPAMHAMSHFTDWVLQVWVHMLLFLAPALLFATVGVRQPERHRVPREPVFGKLVREEFR